MRLPRIPEHLLRPCRDTARRHFPKVLDLRLLLVPVNQYPHLQELWKSQNYCRKQLQLTSRSQESDWSCEQFIQTDWQRRNLRLCMWSLQIKGRAWKKNFISHNTKCPICAFATYCLLNGHIHKWKDQYKACVPKRIRFEAFHSQGCRGEGRNHWSLFIRRKTGAVHETRRRFVHLQTRWCHNPHWWCRLWTLLLNY